MHTICQIAVLEKSTIQFILLYISMQFIHPLFWKIYLININVIINLNIDLYFNLQEINIDFFANFII
jgi:hypothetical protein